MSCSGRRGHIPQSEGGRRRQTFLPLLLIIGIAAADNDDALHTSQLSGSSRMSRTPAASAADLEVIEVTVLLKTRSSSSSSSLSVLVLFVVVLLLVVVVVVETVEEDSC